MIRKRYFAMLAITVILVSASPVMAFFVFSGTSPSDPFVDGSGNVTWSGWEEITEDLPYTTYIPVGGSLFLGLENFYQENWTKTVTLEYEGLVTIVATNTRAGYPAGGPAAKEWDSSSAIHTDWTGLWTVTGVITPQPSWEWIELKNLGTEQIFVAGQNDITITEYSSVCVPEPATVLLFGLGGLALRRRRAC